MKLLIFCFLLCCYCLFGKLQTNSVDNDSSKVTSLDTVMYHGIHYNKHYWKAISLSGDSNLRTALGEYKLALKENTTDSYIYANKGQCELKLADTLSAMTDFNSSLSIDDGNLVALFAKEKLAYEANDLRAAINITTILIKKYPSMSSAYFQRALYRSYLNELFGAIEDYEVVLKQHPENTDVLYNMSNIKCQLKDYSGSLKLINKYIQLVPKDALGYGVRALTKIKLGNHVGGILDLDRGIALDDTSKSTISMLQSRGLAKIQIKNYSGAMKDLTAAIVKCDKPEADLYSARGSI